ncbi:MAG: hypothetical protein MZV64_05210 [Ignavibacteriales bacterium]|nr:hypothetical protein [Ignavibacteriales bacterium]
MVTEPPEATCSGEKLLVTTGGARTVKSVVVAGDVPALVVVIVPVELV